MILNLFVEGADIRSVSWLQPVREIQKSPKKGNGGACRRTVEPPFDMLWTWLFLSNQPSDISEREGFLKLSNWLDGPKSNDDHGQETPKPQPSSHNPLMH